METEPRPQDLDRYDGGMIRLYRRRAKRPLADPVKPPLAVTRYRPPELVADFS